MATLIPGMSVPKCPECDDIIIIEDECACAICGRIFHQYCLDPDSYTCLNCTFMANNLDRNPDVIMKDDHDE